MEKVTALLPVKNVSAFAQAIICDLKNNCAPDDEILVIDDFSTDDTYQKFTRLIGADPRFKIIQNSNPGLSNALNLGIQNASHDWIARFDADDRYSKNRLSAQKKFLSNDVACLFTDYSIHDENSSFLTRIPSPILDTCTKLSLIKNSRTPHPSVIFSKQKAIDSGGYSATEFPAEDLGLWLRMSEKGNCISVPEELLQYTIRRNSVTSEKQSEMVAMRSLLIKNSTIFPDLFRDVSLNWRAYFAVYDTYEQSFERKFLLLLEFSKVGRGFKLDFMATTVAMMLSLLSSRSWPISLTRLLWGRYRIRTIRLSKTK